MHCCQMPALPTAESLHIRFSLFEWPSPGPPLQWSYLAQAHNSLSAALPLATGMQWRVHNRQQVDPTPINSHTKKWFKAVHTARRARQPQTAPSVCLTAVQCWGPPAKTHRIQCPSRPSFKVRRHESLR